MTDDYIQIIEYEYGELLKVVVIPEHAIIIDTTYFTKIDANNKQIHMVRCLIRYVYREDNETEIKEEKNDINYS